MSSFFKSDLVIDTLNTNGDVAINGDLTVTGDTTTVSTTNTVVSDKLLELANGTTGTPSGDAGVVIERGSSNNVFIGWDESEDKVTVATGTFTGASTGDLSLTDAALKTGAINASGDLTTTGDLVLDDGGSLKEAGGTAAFTFDGSGNVTKIGQDSPSSGQFLKYDGAKWVADNASGGVAGSVAADDISAGDAAINLTTTTGNITIDAQGSDTDIIFKGTDGSSDITALTLDMSEAGAATFNNKIVATELDISGSVDVDGTLEANAITVGGTALNTVIAGVTVTNATTAAVATTVTISDNESTNEENAVVFTAGGDVDGGNIGLESDGDLTYNPSTGTLSATIFKGNVDAVDGDFDGTLEADAITVGGTNLLTGGVITSLGTITQDTVTFTSADANDPQVFIKNTTNDSNGPSLVLQNDRGANNGADNDVCGIIEFKGHDDAQNPTTFALVSATVKDASNGSEGGEFGVEVATHDGEMQFGLKITDGNGEDELDVEIGSGINSVTTAAGYIKGANGVLVPEGKSVHIETPLLTSSDHSANGTTTILNASESFAIGDLVYVSGNGTVGKALANAVAKMPAIGLAVSAGNNGQPAVILLNGTFRDDSFNFTAGNRLFAHTDGTITATAPSANNEVSQAVGVALNADVIYFSPDMTLVEIIA